MAKSNTAHQTQIDWETRIKRAQSVREEWAKEFQVETARQYFRGRQNPGWAREEWITINKIYAHLRDHLPALYAVDPYFYIKVKRSFSPDPQDAVQFEQRGKIRQAYLNYLKGEVALKDHIRLAILDAQFEYGVIKTFYSAEQRENDDAGAPILADDGETALVDDEGAPLVEPDTVPINERYNVSRVHPRDFVWDEDAGPLEEKWNWVAERILLTKAEAEKDPLIKQAVLDTAPPAKEDERRVGEAAKRGLARLFSRGSVRGKTRPDDDEKVWVAWEIYDLKKKQWLKIVEGAEEPIIAPRDIPPGIEKHPYSILRFMLLDDTALPLPPISQAIDPQREYGMVRSMILRHRKRFNRKYEVMAQALVDESELDKLEVGEDGTYIRVQQLGAINPIKDAPLDQANYLEVRALGQEMTEILGAQSAGSIERADSATQASLLDKRLDVREGDDLAMVKDFTVDVGKHLDQLVQAHISRDEAVHVTGPQGEFWELVRETDFEAINGEFEYGVNVSASAPRLPQVERAQFLAMLQVLGSFPHIMTSPALMKHLAMLHRIEDEALIEEMIRIGQQIVGGQMQPPGGAGGGQASVEQNNPITAVLGAALGDQGGIAGGGGAPNLG